MPDPAPDQGFNVVDRRRRGGEVEAPEPPRPRPPSGSSPPPRGIAPPPRPEPSAGPAGPPPADFAALCMMFYSDALVHLGQVPDPVTGQPHPDLEQARFMIDLLTMLKTKTEGNRTPEESAVIDQILTNLRMGFVHASRRG